MNVHCELPEPLKCFVAKEFLYDMDPKYQHIYESCVVFGVSSYKGHSLSFKIFLPKTGALFDYIPPHAIKYKLDETSNVRSLLLSDLTYGKTCPDNHITINELNFLKDLPLPYCYFPKRNLWFKAKKYICTVDWYTENENVNIIVLENNQIALVPNHKLVFSKEIPKELPNYRKLNSSWR